MSLFQIDKPLVLYDGECMLCSKAIQFILEHESSSELYFMTLESALAKDVIKTEIDRPYPDSVFFYCKGNLFAESRAGFEILGYLSYPYRALKAFSVLPTFITDALYRWIARNRYAWYGREEDQCPIYKVENPKRFL